MKNEISCSIAMRTKRSLDEPELLLKFFFT
jgi:hypothetical protein